ncbi:MAG: divalent-cation tolerance protein CutA [Cyanobacteriota bacterium ELA615]|jgi:periplasmic divalent cation tolerance protein
MNNHILVLVTTASKEESELIAAALVESRLAACVNIFPISSIYRWQGQIQSDSEYQLFIKTDIQLFSDIEAKIKELHSYSVPEIIAIDIVAGSRSYLNWLGESLR